MNSQKLVLSFFLLLISIAVVSANVSYYFNYQMNFQNGEARNHTQSITYTGSNMTVTVPDGFTLVNYSSGGVVNGVFLSWGSGTARNVNYTIQSPSSCTDGSVYYSNISLDNAYFNRFSIVCTPDNKIVDYKLEYGHGYANYLTEDVISNETATLFNLIRIFNIGHYLDPDEDANNVSINCTFEKFPTRTEGHGEITHQSSSILASFFWDIIEGGYWFRISTLSQDVSKSVGSVYQVNCTPATYNFNHQKVSAAFTNKTLLIRSPNPFNITTSVNSTAAKITYTIQNIEVYTPEDLIFTWKVRNYTKTSELRKLSQNETVKFDLFLDGAENISLNIDFIPSWQQNSLNPVVYTQSQTTSYNINTKSPNIISIEQTLLEIRQNQEDTFRVEMSDFGDLQRSITYSTTNASNYTSNVTTNSTYRAKIWVYDGLGKPKNASANPTIRVFDSLRSIFMDNITMVQLENGIYEFNFSTNSSMITGTWETIATVNVSNTLVKPSDYWDLKASPAQVIIHEITDRTIPTISASASITNEGNAPQEYQYQYCVVSQEDNDCGGGNDLDFGSAAKLLQPGETFNTILTLNNVNQLGLLYFKLVVYFGSEKSAATKSFVAIEESVVSAAGGKAAGGGGGSAPKEVPEILVRAEPGKLNIVDYPLQIKIIKKESLQKSIKIKNIGLGNLTNVKLVLLGLPLNMYAINPEKYSLIGPGESVEFNITFFSDIAEGIYNIRFLLIADEGQEEVGSQLTIKSEETGLQPAKAIKMGNILLTIILVILIAAIIWILIRISKRKFHNYTLTIKERDKSDRQKPVGKTRKSKDDYLDLTK